MQRSRSDNDSPGAVVSMPAPQPFDRMTSTLALRIVVRLGRAVALLALALLAALPAWSYVAAETVPASRAIVLAAFAASALFPASALLACAGLLPLSGPLSAIVGSTTLFGLGEPVVLACLAGWLLRSAVWPGPPPAASIRALRRPALVLAVVVAASGIVEMFVVQPAVDYPWPFACAAFRFLRTDFFSDRGTFGALTNAALFLEGLGLFAAAVTLIGRNLALGRRLLAMAACGAAGVAAHSVVRLVTVSLRTGDGWSALLNYPQTIRISAAFADFNAAGSYLAMALLLVVGLALPTRSRGGQEGEGSRGGRWLGLLWLLVVPLMAAGLWLTGSRAALAAIAPALIVMLPVVSRVPKRVAWGGALVAALVVMLSLPFVAGRFNLPDKTGRSLSQALNYRSEFARGAARMIAAQPVFGVGVGAFYARSGEYFAPAVRVAFPRENAHNNFLQVLAELGVVGFVPFLWTIGIVGAAVVRGWRSGRLPAAATGGAAGLVAFILTWLTGHPLLIFEVATAFWLVLAAVAGSAMDTGDQTVAPTGAVPRAGDQPVAPTWAVAILVLLVIVSVPIRSRDAVQRANLKNAAIGLSAWNTDDRGERFRRMTDRTAQFYVPAEATSMRLPIRLERASPQDAAVNVEIRLDGELANRVRVQGTNWSGAAIVLPRPGSSRRYRAVRLLVVPSVPGAADQAGPAIEIGVPILTGLGQR